MERKKRSLFVLPVLVFVCSFAGGLFGTRVKAAVNASDDPSQMVASFTKAYAVVEDNFAGPVSPDESIYACLLAEKQGVVIELV